MEKKIFRQFFVVGSCLLLLLIADSVLAVNVDGDQPRKVGEALVPKITLSNNKFQTDLDELSSLVWPQSGFMSGAAQTAVCGNSILENGETCDDGNTNDLDGCSDVCQIESGFVCTDPTVELVNVTLDEGFESGVVPPSGWIIQSLNSPTWHLNSNPVEANSGSYSAEIPASTASRDEWLISPSITPTAASHLFLVTKGSPAWCNINSCHVDIWLILGDMDPSPGSDDDFQIYRADDDWPDMPAYTWAASDIDLAGILPSGPVRFAIRYTGVNGAQAFIDDIEVGELMTMPSSCTPVVPDGLELGCNLPVVGFESGIPIGWRVIDNEDDDVIWKNVLGSGEVANFTGGLGDAASVSSDNFFPIEYDTEIRSNMFDLDPVPVTATVTLSYDANFQHNSDEFLDLDISTDGGSNWTTLPAMSWSEDHGSFRAMPGESVTTDLSAYAGQSNLMLRWRYYNPNVNDSDFYAQIDEASLTCDNVTKEAVDFSDLGNNKDVAWHEEPLTGRTLWLGATVDNDANALRSTDNPSDDGVTLTSSWVTGEQATMDIDVSGTSGQLTAWVDWNNDGFDPTDLILEQAVVVGTNALSFMIPASYQTGTTVEVRFRLTSASVGASGLAVDGEVEDYVFSFSTTAVSLNSFSVQNSASIPWFVILLTVLLTLLGGWTVFGWK